MQVQGTIGPINCTQTMIEACRAAPGAAATVQGGAGMQPQATLGPLQCNITVYTLCTPVCGQ